MNIYQAYMDVQQREFVSQDAIPFDASNNTDAGTREYDLFKKIHADPALQTGNPGAWCRGNLNTSRRSACTRSTASAKRHLPTVPTAPLSIP